MPKKIEISHKTIIFTVLFLLSLWFLFQIRQLILILFIAIIFTSALNPVVDRLERWRLPRWLGILILYIVAIGGIGGAIALLIQPLIDQTATVINRIIEYSGQLSQFGIDPNLITSQFTQLGFVPANILQAIVGFFSNIFSVFFVAIITFYLLLERKNLRKYLVILFGEGRERQAEDFVNKIEKQLGGWVRGEAVLMTVIGILTYIGLKILGIEFALPLAIFAGLFEIVPNIGPIISAFPAILIGFSISPVMGLAVTALYFLINQFENVLIAPKVMQKAVGLNPLFIILALAVGLKLAGTMGAILAVPVVLVIKVIYNDFIRPPELKDL